MSVKIFAPKPIGFLVEDGIETMLARKYLLLVVTWALYAGPVFAATDSSYELDHRAKFNSHIKGIYLTQNSLEDRTFLEYLIRRSKECGINTFVIDLNKVTNTYEKNLLLVRNAGITYVARIVVFPLGGNWERLHSESYWLSRYRLVDAAIRLGAQEIQLDYIRYEASTKPSAQNKHDVHEVIKWFKNKIGDRAKLQIDVFGESALKESTSIGQHLPTFADSVDVVCPMLYPSHFEPYQEHAKRPYNVIYQALTTLQQQFDRKTPFRVYVYIELTNYRHKFTEEEIVGYFHSQVKAVEDANADGWYVWSASNKYDRLFNILSSSHS